MADKTIGELPVASKLYDDSLLVLEQQGEACSIAGALIRQFVDETAKPHVEHAETSAGRAGASAEAAAGSARDAADVALHPPILTDENDHWWVWDTGLNGYTDSGIDAGVSLEVVEEIITGEPGTPASVANRGTKTDPRLQFTLPQGEPGVSPTVDVVKDGGVTTVTITDAHGPHTATINDGDVSREALDAALAKKADRSDTDPIVAWHSNPNLLDNAVFIGGGSQKGAGHFPINQNGETNYKTIGTYTIDRWMWHYYEIYDGLTLHDNYITIFGKSWGQHLENERFTTGVYTVSFLTAEGELCSGTGNLTEGAPLFLEVKDKKEEITLCFWYRWSDALTLVDFTVPTIPRDIVAVKVERGPAQTLAHQENGVWVLNEIPNYGTELAKCLHYFYHFTNQLPPGNGFVDLLSQACIEMPLPVPLRARPTVTFGRDTRLISNGKSIFVDATSQIALTQSGITVIVPLGDKISDMPIFSSFSVYFTIGLTIDANL